MPSKNQLIQLIHVAKRELALDDDAYRAAISGIAAGKTSCAQLTFAQLEQLLESFKSAGFKRRVNKSKKRLSPTRDTKVRVAEITKIRAIWITMYKQGMVRDGSETALNSYVKRMTSRLNGGTGIAEVAWLDDVLAYRVLEALKSWHSRQIVEAMTAAGKRHLIPLNDRTGKPAGYDALTAAYAEMIEVPA